MTTTGQDVRQAARGLRRQPGFTATAIVILGLGIGVNTAIFTIFNRFVLQPLPVPDPQTIVRLSQAADEEEAERLSYPDYLDLRDGVTTISDLMAAADEVVTLGDAGAGAGVTPARFVSGNYAQSIGGRAAIGRTLRPDDDRGAADVAVLGYLLWERRFDRDPRVVGRSIIVNGHRVTIAGVMTRDFTGLTFAPTGLWLPIAAHARLTGDAGRALRRDARWVDVWGRLAPGASRAQAQAELSTLAANLARAHPETGAAPTAAEAGRPRILVSPGDRVTALRGGELLFAILIPTATGLFLTIACANLAGVLVARWVSRQRELGVRLALGASRRRLVRQLLTESALLSLAGGAAGLLLASWIAPVIAVMAMPSENRQWAPDLSPDLTVFGFTLLVSALASLLFGALPALHATRVDPLVTLSQGVTLFGQQIRRTRLLNGLVSVQMAVALILLVSATLLVRGMLRISARDPGFDVEHLISVDLTLAPDASATTAGARPGVTTAVLIEQAAEAVRRLPGVAAVSTASLAPLGPSSATLQWRDSQRRPWFLIRTNDVSPGFFDTVRVPLIRGRAFSEDDVHAGAAVVIVNDALARRLWPGADPIGQEMIFPPAYDSRAIVIGVTADAHTANLSDSIPMNLYRPLSLRDRTRAAIVARTTGAPQALRIAVDHTVRGVSARLLIDRVDTGARSVERWLRPARLGSALSTTLGGLALLLTLVGIYGVVAFNTGQRTRELAVRAALGAERRDLLVFVLRQSAMPIAIGVAAGWLALSFLTPLLGAQLHGIDPFDRAAFAGVSAAVVAVTLCAIYLPARRTARLDPIAHLRTE